MNGYQVCERLRADELLRDVPIIFLSCFDDERAKLYAFEAGGVDYITKPFRFAELLTRVKHQIDLRRKQKELTFKVKRMGLEVARRQQTEKAIRFQANTDALTQLYNRRHFFRVALQLFEQALCYQRNLSVVRMDIDHFKAINDTHGHPTGDQVLQTLAGQMSASQQTREVLARYGGEEIVLLLPDAGLAQARERAEQMRTTVARTGMQTKHGLLGVTMSCGVAALTRDNGESLLQGIEQEDQALYRAKQSGRNRVLAWMDGTSAEPGSMSPIAGLLQA